MPSSGGGGGGGKAAKLPGYIQDASQNILNAQYGQFNTPYQAYTGQRVADIDPMRQQAWSNVEGMQGRGDPVYQSAIDKTTGLLDSSTQPINVDMLNAQQVGDTTNQFMNPYTQDVINSAQDEFRRQASTQLGEIGGQAANVGAFGGDRQALLEGQTRVGAMRELGTLTGNLKAQGYGQAMQNAMAMLTGNQNMSYQQQAFNAQQQQADYARQLQAAGMLPGMAAAQQQYGIQDAQALAAAGAARQGHAQDLLNVDYGNFQEKRDYRQQQIDAYARTLAAQPIAGQVVGGGGGAGGVAGGLKGAAGGALAGASAGSVIPGWGTAVGAGVGAVAGGLMGGL